MEYYKFMDDIQTRFSQEVTDYIKEKYEGKIIYLKQRTEINLSDYIDISDITPDMKMIAQDLGIEMTIRLMELYGGMSIHFMRIKSCKRAVMKIVKVLLKNDMSLKQIAKQIKIPLYTINKILGRN